MLKTVRKVRLVLSKSRKAESASVLVAAVLEACWQADVEHPLYLGSYWELGVNMIFDSSIETLVPKRKESHACI